MSGLPRDPDVKFQHPPLILTKTKQQCGSSLSVNTNQFSTKAILHFSIRASKIQFFNNFRNKRINKIQAIKIQENIPFRFKAPVPQQQLLPRIKTFQIKTAAQLLQDKHPIAQAMIFDKIKQLGKNLSQTPSSSSLNRKFLEQLWYKIKTSDQTYVQPLQDFHAFQQHPRALLVTVRKLASLKDPVPSGQLL